MAEQLSQKDYELINSYLDQELDRKDVLKFAERMSDDPAIGAEVADLMKVKAMVKELPVVTPPRNYILTRAMAEDARPKPWWERLFPVFRTAAAFCALALAFTFLFPLLRQQQSAEKAAATETPYTESFSAVSEEAYEEAYEEPGLVEKSLSLYDEEIVLDMNYGEESYHAAMPSYGVMGGNPRIEYMMRLEEREQSMNSVSSSESASVPEGYISVEESAAAQRSLALKLILSGGLLLSLCGLVILGKQKKKMEI